MNSVVSENPAPRRLPVLLSFSLLGLGGLLYFLYLAAGPHPEKAWLVFLVNFLLFTSLSLGALLFSTLMHFTGGKWCSSLTGIAESFSMFFPFSFGLFCLLFIGQDHVFPWLGQDLHGKEIWLNIPFLFIRDLIGFLILYALGLGYIYHSLWFRLKGDENSSFLRRFLFRHWNFDDSDSEKVKKRMTYFAGWFMFAFAMVLSLIGFDLVMSMDPHWFSTLFGAYTFIKAIFSGFGVLIILASVLHLSSSNSFTMTTSQIRDLCTLFFGFSIVWGDFFYAQFLVIWYANIPEETTYIIERTMTHPWNTLAWTVFVTCFILPFVLLLSRKIKGSSPLMIIICSMVLLGFWLEHFLLLAPNYLHEVESIPLSINDLIVTLGFLGLFVVSINLYFRQFPEILDNTAREVM